MKRVVFLVIVALAQVVWAAEPELPRILIDTTYRYPTGTVTTVNSGGNLQTAINNAALNDVLVLEAGATFTGNFTLPNKVTGSGWIYIVSSAYSSLPRPGIRVSPSDAANMAKITASSGTSIIATDTSAHHYRFVGIEIAAGAFISNLVEAGSAIETVLGNQANNIIFDRCYIHGHATSGSKRGVALNGAYISVIDSYLSDFKGVGQEVQAVAGWNGPGPFKIVNNYLEASTENIMFGGVDPTINNLVPSDIEIRWNHLFKPLTWKADDGSYAGVDHSIKNLFELKNAQRVWVANNLMEHNWNDSQVGFALLITVRNQEGTAAWSTVQDVLFEDNHLDGSSGAWNILPEDDNYTSVASARVLIRNNLFSDINWDNWSGGVSRTVQFGGGDEAGLDYSFINNTFHQKSTDYSTINFYGIADGADAFIYKYNIASLSSGGVFGDAVGSHDTGLNYYTSLEVFTENVLTDHASFESNYTGHPGNFFPAAMSDVGFENLGGGDYRIDSASDYYAVMPNGLDYGAFFPSVGQSKLTLDVEASGTSAILRFGRQDLGATTSCTIRYGASNTTSTSGGSRRAVVLTGLTNTQLYGFNVDCGNADGARAKIDFIAATPSGGDRTIPIQIGDPANASVTRCTVDYDDNAALSTPTSVQDTTCSSGGQVNITVPAGVTYWRVKHQDGSDNILATGSVQPLLVQ